MQYTDRNAKESKLEVGDTVVLKNEQRSKLDPNFKPERNKVTGLTGSDMTCENDEGNIISSNPRHLCFSTFPDGFPVFDASRCISGHKKIVDVVKF